VALSTLAVSHAEGASIRYVAPFAVFLALLIVMPWVRLPAVEKEALWVAVPGLVCVLCWPREISLKLKHPLWSVGLGALVFLIWVAPDRLFHGYRDFVVFSNPVVGHIRSALVTNSHHGVWNLSLRTARAVLVVPFVEELFWRAWLMRWLIDRDFQRVALGTYAPFAFWITAFLFASEHGPYWDVGLAAGIVYNLWMVRSKSVADCILMHAVTNGLLCVYIIWTAQWQYWM